MDDEFKRLGKEYNSSIPEFKLLKAIEYYVPKGEIDSLPLESLFIPENYNEIDNKVNKTNTISKKDIQQEQRDRLDRATKNRNNADTGTKQQQQVESAQPSDGGESVVQGDGGSVSSTAASTGSAGSSTAATTTAQVVSTASLTGGVTIISACAIVAATVGSGIMNAAPNVEMLKCNTGADYIQCEVDVTELSPDMNYRLRVERSNQIVYEKELFEDGINKALITGLEPGTPYNVKVVGDAGDIGYVDYYTYKCYTSKLETPEAVFEVEPIIDYELGVYDIEYSIYYSDHFLIGKDPYVEIYSGENLLLTNHNLEEDNFFRGALTNLPDGFEISAKVYTTTTTTYEEELMLVGTYGYIAEYPENFVPKDNKSVATYTFNERSMTQTLNKANGTYTLDLNTEFDNSRDIRDKYRIDIKYNDEIIDSMVSSDKELQFEIPLYCDNLDVVFTPIKEIDSTNVKEFESTTIQYKLNPTLFIYPAVEYNYSGFSYSVEANPQVFESTDILSATIITNYTDETTEETNREFENGALIIDVYNDTGIKIKSFDIIINYNGNVVGKYNYPYPDSGKDDNEFVATYNFESGNIVNTLDKTNGVYSLEINTEFNNIKDTRDKYKLEVLNGEEVIYETISSEEILTVEVPSTLTNVNIVLTPIKELETETKEFTSKTIEYEFQPALFSNSSFRYYGEGYEFATTASDTYFDSNDTLTAVFTTNYSDGSSQNDEVDFNQLELSTDIMPNQGTLDGNLSVDNILIEIKLNDNVVYTFTFDDLSASVTLNSTISVDDDGNVIVPYEVVIPDGATLNSTYATFVESGTFDATLTDLTGEMTIPYITEPSLSGTFEIQYTDESGIVMTILYQATTVSLNLEVVTSSYVTYVMSQLVMHINFETTLDSKAINAQFDIEHTDMQFNEDSGDFEEVYVQKTVSTMYGEYYGIDVYIDDYSSSNPYLKYKITSTGFDNTEQTVTFDKTILNQYASSGGDLFNYSTDLASTDSGEYIKYVKTSNDDGTVNYYFYSGFADGTADSSNVQRIVYSYVKDSQTYYVYSDPFTDEVYKIEGVEDLDYTFKYLVFYKYNDMYYNSLDANAVMSSSSELLDLEYQEFVGTETSESVSVSFRIEKSSLLYTDDSQIMTVTYNNTDYAIPLTGTVETDSYTCEVSDVDDIYLDVSLNIKNTSAVTPIKDNLPVLKYTYLPDVVSKFGASEIINSGQLQEEVSVELYQYSFDIDTSQISIEKHSADSSSTYNRIYVKYSDFDPSDLRDTFKVLVYSGNELISSAVQSYGTATINFSPLYSEVSLVFVELKGDVEYESYDLGKLTFDTFDDIITNDSVAFQAYAYDYQATVIDGYNTNEYSVKVIEKIKDAQTGDINTVEETLTDTFNSGTISFTRDCGSGLISTEIQVILNDIVVYDKVYESPTVTYDTYTYNDGDDSIFIPYTITLPDGATLTEAAVKVNSGNPIELDISTLTGNIEITELQYNTVSLSMMLSYELNGVSYSYEGYYSYQFESIIDLDYQIVPITGSNYAYSVIDVYYDSTNNLIYTYDSTNNAYTLYTDSSVVYTLGTGTGALQEEGYYDSNGNKLDANSLESTTLNNTIYTYRASLIEKIGCFSLAYTDSNYELNVTTSGSAVIDTATGDVISQGYVTANPTAAVESFTLNGTLIQGIYLTFLHNMTDYYYSNGQLYGIHECTLAFNLVDEDGNVFIDKTYTYTEPEQDSIPELSTTNTAINGAMTANNDNTVNLTISPGYDETTDTDYAYKVLVYETLNYRSTISQTLIYESDYLTSTDALIESIKNTSYVVVIETYHISNGNYCKVKDYTVSFVNTAFAQSSNYYVGNGTYASYNKLFIDANYINADYATGTKLLDITLNNVSYQIDLSNTEAQDCGGATVTVSLTDGVYAINIESTTTGSNSYIYVIGSVTINQGNSTIGYTDIEYTI